MSLRFVERWKMLLLLGIGLFLVGAAGDAAHHALPPHLSRAFDPLVGAEAYRAHLVTLIGWATVMLAFIWKGVQDIVPR